MRKIFTVTIVFALAIAFSSCATRKVSRVNTNEVIDLSGRWNDTDSQLVSAEMIDDLLGARWLPVYESQHMNLKIAVLYYRIFFRRCRTHIPYQRILYIISPMANNIRNFSDLPKNSTCFLSGGAAALACQACGGRLY